jgi:twitching motility protein PilT
MGVDDDSGSSGGDSASSAGALLKRFDELMLECVRLQVSDLHLSPNSRPYIRLNGMLDPMHDAEVISAAQMRTIVDLLIDDAQQETLKLKGAVDGAISSTDGTRFRFNAYKRQGHYSVALRRLDDNFRTLGELGLPENLYELCDSGDGLVIVAGPTGAGKSTTLAAFIDRINRKHRGHIITIEDPVEYVHNPVKSLVDQRQVGTDASTFNDALVAALRQDPDVILVGEIREIDTIRTAITAAETGHLVFTTVHAGDCVGAVERLVSVFAADEQEGIRRQLALVLRAVVTQHLLAAIPSKSATEPGKIIARRVSASEVLRVTPAVANMIASAKSAQIYSAMESGSGANMQTLEQDLARLWASNLISESTAIANAKNPEIVRDRVGMMRRRGRVTKRVTPGDRA